MLKKKKILTAREQSFQNVGEQTPLFLRAHEKVQAA